VTSAASNRVRVPGRRGTALVTETPFPASLDGH
jgi:hypothetical protein